LETNVLQVDLDDATGAPIEQRAYLQRLRIAAAKCSEEIFQREAGVDNVFYDKDILTGNVLFKVLRNADHTLAVFAVTRNREKVHREGQIDVACQVRRKENGSAEN